jgi:hypothetical protein
MRWKRMLAKIGAWTCLHLLYICQATDYTLQQIITTKFRKSEKTFKT